MQILKDRIRKDGKIKAGNVLKAVSYTHLDVYKRQTICKAMVEAQGGTIRAFNSPQGGAVFEVSMPMEDRKDE